jgi:hypothetical protein
MPLLTWLGFGLIGYVPNTLYFIDVTIDGVLNMQRQILGSGLVLADHEHDNKNRQVTIIIRFIMVALGHTLIKCSGTLKKVC